MRLLPAAPVNPGDRTKVSKEELIPDIKFKVHHFTKRKRPSSIKNVVIFPIFSEFGSETVVPVLCLPKLIQQKYVGKYTIVVGWHGREYLYRHLVDEFWELGEDYQFLREYCRAFHHDSKNLKRFEKNLAKFGNVVDIQEIAGITIYPVINECPVIINNFTCKGQVIQMDEGQFCTKCGVRYNPVGQFFNMLKAKKETVPLPTPSEEKIQKAKSLLPTNAVGIVGRARKCYGRNLDKDFYRRLIYLIEDLGYRVVWMGEKGVSLACPLDHVFDFTKLPESKDLEFTLAMVAQMKFTVQFWTASTRLAGFVGTPFLLFESPDQIWGGGHEGYRLNICTRGPCKIVASHFLSVVENPSKALDVVKQSVMEMEEGHYRTKVGLVNDENFVRTMIADNNLRVGFLS